MTYKNYCTRCRRTDVPLMKIARSATTQYFICRDCNTMRLSLYRQTDEGRQVHLRAIRRYEKRNPQRRKAWQAVRDIPLEPCERCGTTVNVDRHHEDPTKKRDVNFLCKAHHHERHRELRAMA